MSRTVHEPGGAKENQGRYPFSATGVEGGMHEQFEVLCIETVEGNARTSIKRK